MNVKQQIQVIMKKYPLLTNEGIGRGSCKRPWQEMRQELLTKYSQKSFVKACEWLFNMDKVNSFNKKHASYWIKHVFEEHSSGCYIANGVFIAAAIHSGFKIDSTDDLNPYFNISNNSLNWRAKGTIYE